MASTRITKRFAFRDPEHLRDIVNISDQKRPSLAEVVRKARRVVSADAALSAVWQARVRVVHLVCQSLPALERKRKCSS